MTEHAGEVKQGFLWKQEYLSLSRYKLQKQL